MKTFNLIAKILLALAAIAGAVYVVATYGDKIVAWAKNLLRSCKRCTEEVIVEATYEDAEASQEPAVSETDFEG